MEHQKLIIFIVCTRSRSHFRPLFTGPVPINKLSMFQGVAGYPSGNVPYNNFINLLYRCLTSVHEQQQTTRTRRRREDPLPGNANPRVCNLFIPAAAVALLLLIRCLPMKHFIQFWNIKLLTRVSPPLLLVVHVYRCCSHQLGTGKIMACVLNKDTQIKRGWRGGLYTPPPSSHVGRQGGRELAAAHEQKKRRKGLNVFIM